MNIKNYWNESEYSKDKLMLHPQKTDLIFKVLRGEAELDTLFPISAEMHLTNRCNLSCEWCTDRDLHKISDEMSTEVICRVIAEFAEHQTGITLEGGGEPTLHPDFFRIVQYGKECGASMGLITNGTTDISKMIHCFQWIRISLDASTEEEYRIEKHADCFEKVIQNLKVLSELRDPAHTQLGVGFVLTNRNHSQLIPLLFKLDALGVDYIYIRPVEESLSLKPDAAVLYHLKQELTDAVKPLRIRVLIRIAERIICNNDSLPCIAHSLTTIIHADGDVVMCEKRRHDPRIFGNVKTQSFEEIWRSDLRKNATKCALCPSMQKGCKECRITAYNQLFYRLSNVHSVNFI